MKMSKNRTENAFFGAFLIFFGNLLPNNLEVRDIILKFAPKIC